LVASDLLKHNDIGNSKLLCNTTALITDHYMSHLISVKTQLCSQKYQMNKNISPVLLFKIGTAITFKTAAE
jgi:hypothetical protein